jgi:hypothetical protein
MSRGVVNKQLHHFMRMHTLVSVNRLSINRMLVARRTLGWGRTGAASSVESFERPLIAFESAPEEDINGTLPEVQVELAGEVSLFVRYDFFVDVGKKQTSSPKHNDS